MMRIIFFITFILIQACSPTTPPDAESDSTDRVKKENINLDVKNAVKMISELYFDGVVMLMMHKKMDHKESFRQKFIERSDVVDARVVRNSNIYSESINESQRDELSEKIFIEAKKSIIEFNSESKILSIGVPLTATENTRGVNCIICHKIQSGTVLGVLRIDYSIIRANTENIDEFKMQVKSFLCDEALPSGVC